MHGCIQTAVLFILCMPQREPQYNYLLKHGRESCKLSIDEVRGRTGIGDYLLMEGGIISIPNAEVELFGALFNINPAYIKEHNFQLMLLSSSKHIIDLQRKKIASLTKALKRKIINRKKAQDNPKPKPAKPKR
jgi:hypothetical protein